MKKLVVAISLAAGVILPAAEPLYKAHDPAWEGVWIWSAPVKTPPPLDVDLRQWLEARPGAVDQTLVNRIMGNGAITGYREIFWRLDDGNGKALFPAGEEIPVLKWENWGIDFGKFDYPARARELADRMGIKFTLVASTPEIAAAAAKRYPGAAVIAAAQVPEKCASVVKLSADPRKYLDRETVWFRKRFRVEAPVTFGKLCVTANESYRLWLDGKIVGSGSDGARAKTFDVSELLTPGEHELTARVEPGSDMAGLLVNFRYGSAEAPVTLNTGLDWECRADGAAEWKPVISTGFEGAGARFRLKEPWGYPSPLELLVADTLEICDPASWNAFVDGKKIAVTDWRPENFPAALEVRLNRPEFLGEVRIDAAGFGGFRLEYFDGAKPVVLTPDVPAGEPTVLAFSPRKVDQLRLTALSGTPQARLRGLELGRAAGSATGVSDLARAKTGPAEDGFWEASGRGAKSLSIVDAGAPFGNAYRFAATDFAYYAYHRVKPVTGGEVVVEFDFKVDARGECLNLGVMPLNTGSIDHDTSLLWLLFDGTNGKIKYFSNSWHTAADFKPGKWHHFKLRIFLSGPMKNTFNINIDGGEAEASTCAFRNVIGTGDATVGGICIGGREVKAAPNEAVLIDNISIRAVPEKGRK